MFEELLKEYQKLPIDSKRDKNIEEVKLVVAMLQLLCEKKQIKHDEIDIPNLKGVEDENEYLDLMYIYLTRLKEELGSYVMYNENDRRYYEKNNFTFISYIVSSLNMSRDIRAKAGRAAFTSMGGEGSYSTSSKSDSVTVSSMAAEHLFQGKNELKIREEVKIPNMKIPQ